MAAAATAVASAVVAPCSYFPAFESIVLMVAIHVTVVARIVIGGAIEIPFQIRIMRRNDRCAAKGEGNHVTVHIPTTSAPRRVTELHHMVDCSFFLLLTRSSRVKANPRGRTKN